MITILGGTGYVGSIFRRFLASRNIAFSSLSRSEVDYTDAKILIKYLIEHEPSFLINVAGFTGKPNVDACEIQKTECLMGNAVLPGIIREACEATNTPWGHISSGCIYSGRRADGNGFLEDDPPNFCFRTNNCSFYSGTKALGEEVLEGAQNCYIWRLRIPFDNDDSPRNYLSKMIRYERLLEVENSVSHLDDFVRACWACWDKHVPFGIYNMTNPGSVTTREVVDLIEESGVIRKDFKFFKSEEEFMSIAAKTPRSSCVLDSSKLAKAGIQMRPVHEAIRDALRNWQ